MSDAKWLRQAAKEIRAEGHYGWGNTCEQAADALEAKDRRIAELEAAMKYTGTELGEAREEIERLRAVYERTVGWRECDHPEWFCRRTAEWMADRARAAVEGEGDGR
jgi:hypothetical protein